MKLFTSSYLNNYEILRKAKIGFELEFYSKLNYPMTIEVFNRKLDGIKVWGFKEYHSKFKVDEKNFKLEPDQSGGISMAELVTGPLSYADARIVLVKIMKILQEIGHTNDKCSIHVNISFDDFSMSLNKLNVIKLLLNVEETKIYKAFPERIDNVYAKSVKNVIPFKDYDFSNASANVLNNSLNLPYTKYYGINFSTINDGRLEFRYLGGADYHFKVDDILDMVDYFILITSECINQPLTEAEIKILRRYLDDNISKYKSLSKYDNFLSEFPDIEIQIDKTDNYGIVVAYYHHLFNELFEFISNTKNLGECIINYDTETKNIEIVYAEFECVGFLKELDFIDCKITGGDFYDCEFVGCEVENGILNDSRIKDGEVYDSKLINCETNYNSELKECFVMGGFMDGNMIDGVLRSGKIGENANISDTTKVFKKGDNFFNIKIKDRVSGIKDKKGISKKK